MHITLVAAISKDGFLTKGDNSKVSGWTSEADKQFYKQIRAKHDLIVMGKNTYLAGAGLAVSGTLKIILTKDPSKFNDHEVADQLEFRNLTPIEFVKEYQEKYDDCLLLGGGQVYYSFIKAGLIDEIFLTIEPLIHGGGVPFLPNGKKLVDVINLPAPQLTDLNTAGTKLLHYEINKKA